MFLANATRYIDVKSMDWMCLFDLKPTIKISEVTALQFKEAEKLHSGTNNWNTL